VVQNNWYNAQTDEPESEGGVSSGTHTFETSIRHLLGREKCLIGSAAHSSSLVPCKKRLPREFPLGFSMTLDRFRSKPTGEAAKEMSGSLLLERLESRTASKKEEIMNKETGVAHGALGGTAARICLLGLAVQIALGACAVGQSPQASTIQQTPLMDRQNEIALALSSCPPSVATKAAVYVLEKSGYVKVRDSQNGFTAIVQHALPNSQDPQCMDAEGTRTFLPRYLKIAELRAQGKSREEINRFVADAFAKGIFQPPSRPGVDYMLSSENIVIVDAEKGIVAPFPPHVMFYGPYLTNADLGSDGNTGGSAFVTGEGTPHALIIVPVGAHANHGSNGEGGSAQQSTTK
jgi:hypothetical protein